VRLALPIAVRAAGQDTTRFASSASSHPIVGAWSVNDSNSAPSVAFTADGILVGSKVDGGTGVESPRLTGARTVPFTFVPSVSDAEFSGILVV
jgi:hypothetical protein